MRETLYAAEEIALFCRLNLHMKKNLPIRSSEMGLLIFIDEQKKPITPSLISQFFQITKPTVSLMLGEMIQKNFLRKSKSETDHRSYSVEITDSGKVLVDQAKNDYLKSLSILSEKMGVDDFNSFLLLIKKVNLILSQEKNI